MQMSMQTEWRSRRLIRNTDELLGKKWAEIEVQTDSPAKGKPIEAQTDQVAYSDAVNQTDEHLLSQIAVDYHILHLRIESLEYAGAQVWAEIVIGTEQRLLAAGRTQAETMTDTGVVEFDARLTLHLPYHLNGKMKQQITIWALEHHSHVPVKVCSSSRLLKTTSQMGYIDLDPTAELVIAPITASSLA